MSKVGITNTGIQAECFAEVEFIQKVSGGFMRIQVCFLPCVKLGIAAFRIYAVRLKIMMRVVDSPLDAVQVIGVITPLNLSAQILNATGERKLKTFLLRPKGEGIIGVRENGIHEELGIDYPIPA